MKTRAIEKLVVKKKEEMDAQRCGKNGRTTFLPGLLTNTQHLDFTPGSLPSSIFCFYSPLNHLCLDAFHCISSWPTSTHLSGSSSNASSMKPSLIQCIVFFPQNFKMLQSFLCHGSYCFLLCTVVIIYVHDLSLSLEFRLLGDFLKVSVIP